MLRIFVERHQIVEQALTVTGSEVGHMVRVLRMREGDDFEAVDEEGVVHACRIMRIGEDEVFAEVLFSEASNAELPNEITLYMALPKFDKMELVIQKAVELGAVKIVPVRTARCVVKLDEKRAEAKVARWQQIAKSAAEQAKRIRIPEVGQVIDFASALAAAKEKDTILFPYEGAADITRTRAMLAEIKEGVSLALFIGPEGGFAEAEVAQAIDAGAKVITLGRRILRTETAAIASLAVLMFQLEKY